LEKLLRQADEEAGDEYYEFCRRLARDILDFLPKIQFVGGGVTLRDIKLLSKNSFLFHMLGDIAAFSRTPEEALALSWRLAEAAFECAGHPFTREYNSQTVLEPEKIYGGQATDDASEKEVEDALRG
jgi:hypothetical protein